MHRNHSSSHPVGLELLCNMKYLTWLINSISTMFFGGSRVVLGLNVMHSEVALPHSNVASADVAHDL